MTTTLCGNTPSQAIRDAFDYEHGGFTNRGDRDVALSWLHRAMGRSTRPYAEDSGDLYRIWCPNISGYFWPEDATEDRWVNAA